MERNQSHHGQQLAPVSLDGATLPKTIRVREHELTRFLIEVAGAKKWDKLESYLSQIDLNEKARGAPLMRALNTPLESNGMTLPAVLIYHGAPLSLIRRVFELGASTSSRFSLREVAGGITEQCSLMHLAVLSARPDLVSYVADNIRGTAHLANSLGESPTRTLARVLHSKSFLREDVSRTAAIATAKYLASGGSDLEVALTVSALLSRNAWDTAASVLDSWMASSTSQHPIHVKGSDICKWVCLAIEHNAPSVFFKPLKKIAKIAHLTDPIDFTHQMPSDLVLKLLPSDIRIQSPKEHDWSVLTSCIERLEWSQGLIPAQLISGLFDAKNESIPIRADVGELETIGLINPLEHTLPMSVFQCMILGGAPREAIQRAIKLGADTSYNALVEEKDTYMVEGQPVVRQTRIWIAGPALHVAVARGDADLIQLILENGVDPLQKNQLGMTAVQYLFAIHPILTEENLPLLEVLLSAAPKDPKGSVWRTWGPFEGKISTYDAFDLFAYAELSDAELTAEKPPAIPPELRGKKFSILDGTGRLVEADYLQVRHLVEVEFGQKFSGLSIHKDKLTTILNNKIASVRSNSWGKEIAERIARALQSPLERKALVDTKLAPAEEPGNDSLYSEDPLDAESYEDTPDENYSKGEFLSFPELGDAEHGFAYEDEESELPQLDGPSEAIDSTLEDREQSSSAPSEAADSAKSALASESSVDGAHPIMEVAHSTPLADYEEQYLSRFDLDSLPYGSSDLTLPTAIRRSFKEGLVYEAYLLLKTLDEIRPHQPSKLSAFSRSLQSLLYRFNPSVASKLVHQVDGSYEDEDGNHPYMAEFLCLLRHPLDKERSPRTLGGLTLGITGVAQLVRQGSLRADLVESWGQIGTWNFSFPVWRFDSQAIRSKLELQSNPSLMELAGMEKIHRPVDEFVVNESPTRNREHLLGALFVVRKGTKFHDLFDQDQATSLGFAPLHEDSVVMFRRACIIVYHPQHGTLVIRNSSHNFGRDRFASPGLWRGGVLSREHLLNLSKKEIESTFKSVVGRSFVADCGLLEDAGGPLTFLMQQAITVRAAYARMKFDTNLSTAWSKRGHLLGGYRSPLFKHIVELVADRFAMFNKDGKTIVPELAFANPDFFPAPHARLSTTPLALEVLKRLANGEQHRLTELQLRQSGVRHFFDTGFKHGKDSELVLLPPEK